MWLDLTLGPSFMVRSLAKHKNTFNLLIMGHRGLGCETNV